MSVFTPVSREQLVALLKHYRVGTLVDFEGISAGVENSNFYLTTDQGQYVLTIFERVVPTEIPYFLSLTRYLAANGIPCAEPQPCQDEGPLGMYVSEIAKKPAAIVERLPGHSLDVATLDQCHSIGRTLAQYHSVSQYFPRYRANPYSNDWYKKIREALAARLDLTHLRAIDDALSQLPNPDAIDLPRGTVHTDLFRDNVLVKGGEIGGLVDFYYACTDVLLLDIATVANDWCVVDGHYDPARECALLDGYQTLRTLTPNEVGLWPAFLKKCALRFWLSRLYDKTFPRTGGMVLVKDPAYFHNIIEQHAANANATLNINFE